MSFRLVIVLACVHHCGSPSLSLRERIFPSFHDCFVSGFHNAQGDAKFRCDRIRREPQAAKVAPKVRSKELKSVAALLSERESGGHAAAINRFGYAGLFQFGAPRLTDLHVYTPAPNESLTRWPSSGGHKWQGSFHIPGHPDVITIQDFLKSVPAQEAVFKIHLETMQHQIYRVGLSQYLGSTIEQVPITMGGIEMMIHLGGVGGARRVLASEGRHNPHDANGTSLIDYARWGATISEEISGLDAP